jgi:hypothetical protein
MELHWLVCGECAGRGLVWRDYPALQRGGLDTCPACDGLGGWSPHWEASEAPDGLDS